MAAKRQTAIRADSFEVRALGVTLGGQKILENVSFTCEAGLTALLGKNGAGKTTLMRALTGAVRADGSVYLHTEGGILPMDQLSARERAGMFAYAAQEPAKLSLTASEFVLLGCAPFTGLFSLPDAAQKHRVRQLFEEAGMTPLRDRPYNTLSGGEKKTANFLRTLVQDASWLLLDEPLAGLDFEKQHAFCEQLVQTVGHTVAGGLVSLHDPSLALRYFDRVLILHGGRILAQLDKKSPTFEENYLAALRVLYGSRAAYTDTPFGKTVIYE